MPVPFARYGIVTRPPNGAAGRQADRPPEPVVMRPTMAV